MISGHSEVVTMDSSSMTRRECFEANICKFYKSGVPKDMLCLAMGISKEELSNIVKKEMKVSL